MHASQKSVFTPDWISVQVCVQRQRFSLETIPVCWNLLPHVVKQTRLSEQRAKGGGKEGNWTGNLAGANRGTKCVSVTLVSYHEL